MRIPSLHRYHRFSAIIIGLFITLHLLNHGLILLGPDQHIALMKVLRTFYRHPAFELPLLFCCGFQIVSGLVLVYLRRGKRISILDRAQAMSGLYIAFFLCNHLGAVFYARNILNLDTNLYFGIAGLHTSPYPLFFIPYYFLAVLAVFVHIGAACHWLLQNCFNESIRNLVSLGIIGTGTVLASVLILAFSGFFQEIHIPEIYLQIYQ